MWSVKPFGREEIGEMHENTAVFPCCSCVSILSIAGGGVPVPVCSAPCLISSLLQREGDCRSDSTSSLLTGLCPNS